MGILNKLLGKEPTSGDEDVRVGAALFMRGQFAFAIPRLERALRKPLEGYSRSEVLTIIGNCHNALNHYDKALEYHDRALQENPRNHKALVNKGVVYRLKGDYDKARECYDQALEIAPDYAELHVSLGALLELQEEYDEAIQHLERAVQMNDGLAVAHANLSLAYAGAGRFDEADASLRAAVVRGYAQEKVIKNRIREFRKKAQATAAATPAPKTAHAAKPAMVCCVCGKDLSGGPAMVDKLTGEAFCENDSQYFGMDPKQRPTPSRPGSQVVAQ
jgi:tetratricopeptide (TPR) repeat protein